jgi:hypothetical protein
MKTKQIFLTLTILSILLFASISHAVTFVKVYNSGNWSSTVPDHPWPGGVFPTTNNLVEIYDGVVITNDTTNAACMAFDTFLYPTNHDGSVVMGPGSTLIVGGVLEGYGTQSMGVFNPTATNCTVIYEGNAFWAKRTNYWNLKFNGWGDFYNGAQNGYDLENMTIFGNLEVNGTNVPSDQTNVFTGVDVECGAGWNILGELYVGQGSSWNCSTSDIVVMGPTVIDGGILWDNAAGFGTNYFGGGLTILPNTNNLDITGGSYELTQKFTNGDYMSINGTYNPNQTNIYMGSWYLQDASEWTIGGNLTNNGNIGFGTNYGSVTFSGTGTNFGSTNYGTGVITGSNAIFMPTMTIDGTYTIADTINLLTNYPTVNGTVVFDIGNTNLAFDVLSNTFDPLQITLNAGTNWFWYSTNGTLDVINSGPAPVSGNTYQLFNNLGNTNYGGGYASITLPSLTGGLSWVTNLLANGSITVAGAAARPIITSSHYNPATLQFTLTWTSVTGAMYTVQETPGLNPIAWGPLQTNIASGGSTTTTTVTMPAGTKGFLRILVQ